jgi:glycosyltransferase involved in cell wall biosynthesis
MNGIKVSVALCTYNGERYLGDLLDSLCSQKAIPFELVVSDDCSTDSTIQLINDFKHSAPFNIRILINKNRRGVIQNFENALSACNGEYIALCDQDDVWKQDKFEILLKVIGQMGNKPGHGPYFVHTDLDLTDSQLNKTGVSFLEHQGLRPPEEHQYKTLIAQNYIPGCSTLFSRDLLEYALPIPEAAVMHDWWLALIASMAGEIRYEPSRTVLYRQHEGNVLGSEARFSIATLRKIIAIKPALEIIEKNFTASAAQAIAATERLSSKNIKIPDTVSDYVGSLKTSRLRSLASVITGKTGRANLLRNATLLLAILLYDKNAIQHRATTTAFLNNE